nr:hypothetical protein GCM10020092_021400 [Actinoplanes digitatis]
MRLKPRALTRGWLALATAVVAALPAATPAVAAAPSTPAALPHAVGGYLPSPVLTSAKTKLGDASAFEVLPDAVDLRQYAPPAGDQGQIGSCVAWTIGYSIMGYYANRSGGSGAPYAPLFLYMRNVAANGAPNAGLNPDAVLTNAQAAGVDTQDHYWQGTTNWQSPPTQDEIDNARDYRVDGWSQLFVGGNQGTAAQTLIQRTLASGRPVALAIPVYQDFMYLRGHSLYDTLTGSSLGGHMIAAYGYDGQGVYIRNSWGTRWGNAGDAKLSWAFINKAATGGYAVDGIATPAAPATAAPDVTGLEPSSGPTYKATPVVVRGAEPRRRHQGHHRRHGSGVHRGVRHRAPAVPARAPGRRPGPAGHHPGRGEHDRRRHHVHLRGAAQHPRSPRSSRAAGSPTRAPRSW